MIPSEVFIFLYLESKHLDVHESEGVVSSEEAADAEDELPGEVPQLGQEAVQEEGQGQAAHGDRDPDGIDNSLHYLTDTLLHVETDIGKVCHIPLVNVGEVV